MIVKERLSGMYRLSAYYLAKISSESPVLFIYPTLYWTLIYFLTGLTIHPANFFISLTAIYLTIFVVQVRAFKNDLLHNLAHLCQNLHLTVFFHDFFFFKFCSLLHWSKGNLPNAFTSTVKHLIRVESIATYQRCY